MIWVRWLQWLLGPYNVVFRYLDPQGAEKHANPVSIVLA